MKWISFLRKYGPISRNDNMYDETIRRSANWAGFEPIHFEHPAEKEVLHCFNPEAPTATSVILTGTAGDGKTHLCRQVWNRFRGTDENWASDNPYLQLRLPHSGRTLHFIRDLSGWAPQQGLPWEAEKEELLQRFCRAIFNAETEEFFLLAANDGQLVESWRRLAATPEVLKARQVFESMLVEDAKQADGVNLRMFNMSRWSSADIFDRAHEAFVNHPGWKTCYEEADSEEGPFSDNCPIRRNLELLNTPLLRSRLRALIELCHRNDLHIPIRQILLLLTNAVLGHSDCNQDRLLRPSDIQKIVRDGSTSKASIYNNIFGGNLTENRRAAITVFEYFERFQIGQETTNRVDSILIFGEGDEQLHKYFDQYLASDSHYGADERYFASRNSYIEDAEEDLLATDEFLNVLVEQRRALFFKITEEQADELKLWELTVFRYGGEYLNEVVGPLQRGLRVTKLLRNRLLRGLNRIFSGMLLSSDRELLLATSGHYSQARISRILKDRISADPRHGERVEIEMAPNGKVLLSVHLSNDIREAIELNLVRYEFLSRVSIDGALPANFSKECYEDILAFKSRLLAAHECRLKSEGINDDDETMMLRILALSPQGTPDDRFIEIRP